jgi:hypothetical protein
MGAKLRATGPQTLISGYRNLGQGRAQELVGRVLDLTSGILARDPAQLRRSFLGGSDEGVVRVWEIRTGCELRRLEGIRLPPILRPRISHLGHKKRIGESPKPSNKP